MKEGLYEIFLKLSKDIQLGKLELMAEISL